MNQPNLRKANTHCHSGESMNTQFINQQKPNLVNVIAWMTLASGIVNLIWGIAASGTALATFVGIICIPITILPTILGIFEIVYAAKLMSIPPQPTQPSTNIAILEIICVLLGNVFSMVVGILALVFYNDLVVKDYFARLNGALSPSVSDVSVMPAAMPDLQPSYAAQDKPASAVPSPTETSEESTPTEEPPSSDDETPKG
jgi:hypothetical protein